MEDDILAKSIPILVTALIAAIPISAQFFAFLKRRAALKTVRLMVERCEPVDQAALAMVAAGTRRKKRDLRRALLLLALVPPGIGIAFLLEGERATLFALFVTGLPLLLGLAHLAFHILLPDTDDS